MKIISVTGYETPKFNSRKKEIGSRIRDEIEDDLRFALDSPNPRPEEALTGVYAP